MVIQIRSATDVFILFLVLSPQLVLLGKTSIISRLLKEVCIQTTFVLKKRLRCKVYEVRLSLLHLPDIIIFFFLEAGDSVKVTRKM